MDLILKVKSNFWLQNEVEEMPLRLLSSMSFFNIFLDYEQVMDCHILMPPLWVGSSGCLGAEPEKNLLDRSIAPLICLYPHFHAGTHQHQKIWSI
jgi:hypothetical protein